MAGTQGASCCSGLTRGCGSSGWTTPTPSPFLSGNGSLPGSRPDHPEIIFLAEAFTRPKVMYRLAKLGFSQSYTYFAWRNTKWELTQYFTELTQYRGAGIFPAQPVAQHPGHPDGIPAVRGPLRPFMIRLVLAATLGANYGIYGPPFELCLTARPGSRGARSIWTPRNTK